MIHVTHHACERFIERVQRCSIEQARAHILESAAAIVAAADFGCKIVRRGHGERLLLEGMTVVTVYAPRDIPGQCRNPFRQRFLDDGGEQ